MKAEARVQGGAGENLYAATFGTIGPHVVLLHGFGGASNVWQGIAEKLDSDHRVIAYDLPGHGRSFDYPGGGPPKIAARAVIDDLRSRGLASVHVVGHSMGGAIAVLTALDATGLVASLTLVAPGGMGEEINAPLLRRFGAAHTTAEIASCLMEMSAPHAADFDQAARALVPARRSLGQQRKLEEVATLITRNEKQGVIPREMLASLAMPVSVLWGTGDAMLPFAQTRNLPPNFEVKELPGAGHMLIEEAPEAIIAMIRSQTATPRLSPPSR